MNQGYDKFDYIESYSSVMQREKARDLLETDRLRRVDGIPTRRRDVRMIVLQDPVKPSSGLDG